MQNPSNWAARRPHSCALSTLAALTLASLAGAQSVPVSFNNNFDTGHLVYDPAGARLVGTNYLALLLLDTPTGLVTVTGPGSGLFRQPGTAVPGTWTGGTRQLPGIGYDQPVKLEVRIWDVSLYTTYEAAVIGGGITGTSGLFAYTFGPSAPPSPTDTWLKNLPSIRLVDQPSAPPLVESITPGIVGEGEPVEIVPKISGGTEPLTYLWQLSGGVQITSRNLQLPAELLRPGYVDFDLTVTDSAGRSSSVALFRLDVTNRAPVVRSALASGAVEGEPVAVHATADYAWPANAVQARWTLPDGRSTNGMDALLPLLRPGQHTVQLQLDELGLVTLYDNLDSIAEPAHYHVPTAETGDELIFSRTNQTVHEVSIYYYADLSGLFPAERAKAGGRLLLYRNDGPLYPGTKSRTPGTLLYESAPFGLNSGYSLQRFTDLNLLLPDRLTWTVVWTNVPQTAGKNAGLVVGDTQAKPAGSNVGSSYNDYWVRSDERWELYHFDGFKPVANFASRATALGAEVQARSLVVPVTFTVTNVAPVITSFAAPAELDLGLAAEFRVSAADVGPEPLSYSWDFGDNSGAVTAVATHAYTQAGTFSGSVTVRDLFDGEVRRSFTVSVAVDRRPLTFISTPPLVATQDQDYVGEVAVNPPGAGQVIALQAVTLPSWLHWQPAAGNTGTGRLVGRPGNGEVGPHAVELEAADGVNRQRLAVTVVVQNVNDAPTIQALPAVHVPLRQGLANLVVTLGDPDPADSLSLTARSLDTIRLPADRLVLGGTGLNRTLSILPTAGTGGEVPVELEVSDGQASRQVTIIINLLPPPQFQVTSAASAGGSVALDPVADRYEQDFPLRITATPSAGWELRRWLGLPGGPVAASGLELTWPVADNATVQGDFADIAAPLVQWEAPAPGITDQRVVTLTGRVMDNDRVANARLLGPGGTELALNLVEGRYEVPQITLQDGENRFAIEARDAGGNASTNSFILFHEPGSVLLVGNAPDTREGQIITFPVQLKNAHSLAGLSFNLHFGDYTEFLGEPAFEAIGLPASALTTVNTTEAGIVRVGIATAGEPIPAGRHDLGQLRLRVRSLLSPLGLQAFVDPELLEVSDTFGAPVAGVGSVPGQARLLPRRITGDLNGNDQLDIGDAGLLQRLLVGSEPRRSWDTALNDLNKNGAIDSGDVVKVMRAVVGLDAQPIQPTAGAAWPGARSVQRSAVVGGLELTPAALTVPRSGTFELQVRLPESLGDVRAVRFRLNYPAQFLALQNANGYAVGAAVPAAATVLWNSAPTRGQLTFGAMSANAWTTKDAVIATLRFQVSGTVPPRWNGTFSLGDVVVTADGYDLSRLPGAAGELALPDEQLTPKVSRMRLNEGGGVQFDMLANTGTTLVLEGSSDLSGGPKSWRPLVTRVHDQLPLFLVPPTDGAGQPAVQFFRVRANAPAFISPVPPGAGGR